MHTALFWRALFAFVALPGSVAYAIPVLFFRPADGELAVVGLLPLAAGSVLLLWCVREFYSAGRGTLAPWSPPVHLVTTGPYRITRNPMYVAVLLILVGWAILFRSPSLWLYTAVGGVAVHLRVVLAEEPW